MRIFYGLFSLVFVLTSCSSVHVVDYWKKEGLEGSGSGKILVFVPMQDEVARLGFEKNMEKDLKSKGYDAYSSHILYPKNTKPKDSISEEDVLKFKSQLGTDGIDIVIMTVLKEKQQYTSTQSTGTNYGYYRPRVYGRYYGGFYGYYGSYYSGGMSGYGSSITTVDEKYILETVVYDLRITEEDQLLGGVTFSVDNPKTLGASSEEVANKIIRELTKKVN